MNRFIIDEASHELLEQWRKENQNFIRRAALFDIWYFKKFEIDYGTVKAYCENHARFFEIKVKSVKSGALGTLKLTPSEKEGEDFGISVRTQVSADESTKNLFLQISLNALTLNSLLIFGNLVEPSARKIEADAVSYGGDKIFAIKPYRDTCYAVPAGTRKSPEGVFRVRGHFRRYANGKVIWIDEYLKGLD